MPTYIYIRAKEGRALLKNPFKLDRVSFSTPKKFCSPKRFYRTPASEMCHQPGGGGLKNSVKVLKELDPLPPALSVSPFIC